MLGSCSIRWRSFERVRSSYSLYRSRTRNDYLVLPNFFTDSALRAGPCSTLFDTVERYRECVPPTLYITAEREMITSSRRIVTRTDASLV